MTKVSKLHTSFFKTKKELTSLLINLCLGLALLYRYYHLTWRILRLTIYSVFAVLFYFYIVMEECNFLSIVISFVRNISLLTYCLNICVNKKAPPTHSVHWGLNSTSKTSTPSFLRSHLLNLKTIQAPILGITPLPQYIGSSSNPLRIRFFSELPY